MKKNPDHRTMESIKAHMYLLPSIHQRQICSPHGERARAVEEQVSWIGNIRVQRKQKYLPLWTLCPKGGSTLPQWGVFHGLHQSPEPGVSRPKSPFSRVPSGRQSFHLGPQHCQLILALEDWAGTSRPEPQQPLKSEKSWNVSQMAVLRPVLG